MKGEEWIAYWVAVDKVVACAYRIGQTAMSGPCCQRSAAALWERSMPRRSEAATIAAKDLKTSIYYTEIRRL